MNIDIRNLSYAYRFVNQPPHVALRSVSLNIRDGEFLSLVGPSGAGKTTLMQHLNGLLAPDSGLILSDGQNIHSPDFDLASLRKRIGLVFQFPETQLFGETVFDDVAFAPRNFAVNEARIPEIVHESLRAVGLNPQAFASRSPFRLSFGEKRKVAIAGILAMQPEVLVLDEPTAGLDLAGTQAVVALLKRLQRQSRTLILISHNLDLVTELVERIVVLNRGEVAFDGHKDVLFRSPDILRDTGLSLPRIRRVTQYLQRRGWVTTADLNSLDEIERELRKQFELRS